MSAKKNDNDRILDGDYAPSVAPFRFLSSTALNCPIKHQQQSSRQYVCAIPPAATVCNRL
jgi:hypothetical protein